MAIKRSVAVTAVILVVVVALLGSGPGLGIGAPNDAPNGEYLLVIDAPAFTPPPAARPAMASYLYYLRQRTIQRDLVPFLLDLEARGYISSYELLEPPNVILVNASTSRDRLAAELPNKLHLTTADEANRLTAEQELQAAAPRSASPLAAPYFTVRKSENQVVVSGLSAGDTVTATVQPAIEATPYITSTDLLTSNDFSFHIPNDYDIGTGTIVTVTTTSGALNRSLVVPELTARADIAGSPSGSQVSGDKPVDADLQVVLLDYESSSYTVKTTTATPVITYSVPFTSPAIVRADEASVLYTNSNGDGVVVYTHPDFVRIYSHRFSGATGDKVMGFTSAPWGLVDLTLKDQTGATKIQKTDELWGAKNGEYWWEATEQDGIRFSPYDVLSVGYMPTVLTEVIGASATPDVTSDTLTVSFSSLLDPASVGSRLVRGMIAIDDPNPPARQGYTDSAGQIVLNFGASPYPYDLAYGDIVEVYYTDPNGNQVVPIVRFDAPAPTVTPSPTATPTPTAVPEFKLYLPAISRDAE